jgi:GTP cyclohydrolase I
MSEPNCPVNRSGLVDIQSSGDDRGIPLRHVGVSRLRYPMTVWDRQNRVQSTVGTFRLTVDLPHDYKGTHMSRFIEALEAHRGEISLETLPGLVDNLRERLDAERAAVRVDFPYFVRKKAPVSGLESSLEILSRFVGEAGERDAVFTLGVDVPVMTLCPCSKAISDYGAHCQRGTVRIDVRFREMVWIEELVEIAEASASAPIFTLLKRDDEKWVTERSYENPTFVEDVARNVALRLRDDTRITFFEVEVENDESIHAHNAYASVGSDDLKG